MDEQPAMSPHRRWAAFRHAVIGTLSASPPGKGELAGAIRSLSERTWRHPVTGEETRFGFSTIEGWFYQARRAKDPVDELRWKSRSDIGRSRALTPEMAKSLEEQYARYPFWSCRIHADNFLTALAGTGVHGALPSYQTIRRYMRSKGLTKRPRPRDADRASVAAALAGREQWETRSYQVEYVNALWHADCHMGSLKVLAADGQWHRPILIGFFDDFSRLACHAQWYLSETAEDFVHALSQAILKRGLPREIMTDNGSAMTAGEYKTGLTRLGITPRYIKVRRPNQNGKCEFVWSQVEGRLLAMLEGQKDLTLRRLNDLTQAWLEMDYNRHVHRETKEMPLARFAGGKDVGRPSPTTEALRRAFRREVQRRQRRSDGTITVDGTRFELPQRLRHILDVTVAYATWDMTFVHVIDPRSGHEMAAIHPIDKAKNASGVRRRIEDPVVICPIRDTTVLPPLLERYEQEYGQAGLVPAYLPKDATKKGDDNDSDRD